MEWGPERSDNRSILADPRRADMKDVLNAKIKGRAVRRQNSEISAVPPIDLLTEKIPG
jgi:Carbamoyltransferase C-terminus